MGKQQVVWRVLGLLALLVLSGGVSADNVYPFTGLDTLGRRLNKVYSAAVSPQWLGDSNFFWYKNHEREGDVYYLVNAVTGEKKRAAKKESLAGLLDDNDEHLAVWLSGRPETGRNAQPAPAPGLGVLSPDGKWRAYIRDCNVGTFRK